MKTLGIKWLLSVLAIPLGLLLIGLTHHGWFGLLSAVALPLAILYTFEFGAELRQQPGWPARLAGWILAIPQTLFTAVAVVIGVSIALWVLYNLFVERQPEFRGGSIALVAGLTVFGLQRLSQLFRKPAPTALLDSGFWFHSNLFVIGPGEDADTHPGIHGRALAFWLQQRLAALGYAVEPPVAEDWGWCVVCQRQPVLAWIGCGGQADADDAVPAPTDIDWHCFVEVERVPWRLRSVRRDEIDALKRRLQADLQAVLAAEPRIRLQPPPTA